MEDKQFLMQEQESLSGTNGTVDRKLVGKEVLAAKSHRTFMKQLRSSSFQQICGAIDLWIYISIHVYIY